MDVFEKYEFLAKLEVEKKLALLPRCNGTKSSLIALLTVAIDAINELDKELLRLAAEYIDSNKLNNKDIAVISRINADSLSSYLRSKCPSLF